MGSTHSLSGAVVGLAAAELADLPLGGVVTFVVLGWVSALLPDVDHPSAPAARLFGPLSWVACWAVRWVSVRATGTAHRGLSHSLVFAAGWGVLVGAFASVWLDPVPALYAGVAAALGCAVHVAGDMVTKTGCRYVLWPAAVQVSVPVMLRIRTGGPAERVVSVLLVVSGALLVGPVLT